MLLVTCDFSDASSFARAAAVMRDRGDVDDRGNLEANCLKGTDRGVTAEAGTGDADLNVLQTVRHRIAGGILSDHLRGIRGRFTRATEVALASRRPSDDGAFLVGNGNDRVVERGEDVGVPGGDVLRTLRFAHLN